MITFIANRIITAADTSLEQGQNKYRAYFVNTALYRKYQDEVDAILRTDGYADIIVTL